MKNLLNLTQTTSSDTASAMQNYAEKWDASAQVDQSSLFIQTMASNDLILVVLAVTLIIWFVLLFYIIRTDRKISKLEKTLMQQTKKEDYET